MLSSAGRSIRVVTGTTMPGTDCSNRQAPSRDRRAIRSGAQSSGRGHEFASASMCFSSGRFQSVSQIATIARSWSGRVAGNGVSGPTYSMSRVMSDSSIRNSNTLFCARSPGLRMASKRTPADSAEHGRRYSCWTSRAAACKDTPAWRCPMSCKTVDRSINALASRSFCEMRCSRRAFNGPRSAPAKAILANRARPMSCSS